MKKLWNKRIPTLFGIGLVAISVLLTSFFIKNPTFFKSSASLIDEPQNITITNISDTSFTVSYLTKDILPGTISFGKDTNLGFTEIEDLDRQKGSISSRTIHVTTLSNLAANTKYYFAINSGQTTFLNNNAPFEAVTGPSISAPVVPQIPINGKVILPDGNVPTQTIVYLTILGAQSLSTPVNENGNFSFIFDFLRSEDLSTYFNLEDDSNVKITFVNELFSSRVLSLYNQTNPLPTIALSSNYDFTFESNISTSSASPKVGGFQEILPSPSNKPTSKISPTSTTTKLAIVPPTIVPTSTPTPSATPTPTPTPDLTLLKQIPPTGSSDILIIGIISILITSGGIILFLLTRSKTSL